jgi:hypothetical protein
MTRHKRGTPMTRREKLKLAAALAVAAATYGVATYDARDANNAAWADYEAELKEQENSDGH